MGAAFQHRGVSSSRVQLTGAETHEKGGWHGVISQAGGSSDHYSGSAGCSPRVLHVGYLLSLLAAADPSRAVQLPAAGAFSRLPPASSITRLVPPLLVPFPTTPCAVIRPQDSALSKGWHVSVGAAGSREISASCPLVFWILSWLLSSV